MIRTLVVEDDALAARVHAEYVRRVPGFEVVAVSRTGAEALHELTHTRVDLVLLDMNLPDLHGLEIYRIMRARGVEADVIAVTSARELETVRSAVAHGVTQYLLKPFTFAALRDRLVRYAEFHAKVVDAPQVVDQREVDRLLGGRGAPVAEAGRLPKGMSVESLERVIPVLREGGARTATEVGEAVGMSRVGVRRYLEYLVECGLAGRDSRYGGPGRPEIEYTWRP